MYQEVDIATEIALQGLKDFNFPSGCGLILTGSIGDGFGNSLSDIDVIVLDPADQHHPTLRQMTHINGRRCEYFLRSAPRLKQYADSIERFMHDDCSFESEDFDRYIRFYHEISRGIVLGGESVVAQARTYFDTEKLDSVILRAEKYRATKSIQIALACADLGLPEIAFQFSLKALRHALSHFAATKGLTNRAEKFVFSKARRANIDSGLLAQVMSFFVQNQTATNSETVQNAARLVAAIGVRPSVSNAEVVLRDKLRHAIIWDQDFLASSRELFRVRPNARQTAQFVANREGPVKIESLTADQRELYGELVSHGIVDIVLPDIEVRWGTTRNPAHQCQPFQVTWSGILLDADQAAACLTKLDACVDLVIQCGLKLSQAAMEYSNMKEDVLGALQYERWDEVRHGFIKMGYALCTIALAAKGTLAVPPPEALLGFLRHLHDGRPLSALMDALLNQSIHDAASALLAYKSLQDIEAEIPQTVKGMMFHTFESGQNLFSTIYSLVTWAEAALNLGLPLSITLEDNAEESMAAVKGGVAVNLMTAEALQKAMEWSRIDDVEAELRQML